MGQGSADEDDLPASYDSSPVISIQADSEGYRTPSPASGLQCLSVSSESKVSELTPQRPFLRPLETPVHEFGADGLDLCLSKSRLDQTFSHLRICFNSDTILEDKQTMSTLSPPHVQVQVASSAQSAQEKFGKNICVLQ
jgi:hypothetical protein